MKPFNLEEAKSGKPVCTRDGKEAKILDFDFYTPNYQDHTKPNHSMLVKLKRRTDDDMVELYRLNGLVNQDGTECEKDLMMKTEKHKGFAWVSPVQCIYGDEAEAMYNKRQTEDGYFLAKIEWED